jgi:hypothetical protein
LKRTSGRKRLEFFPSTGGSMTVVLVQAISCLFHARAFMPF